MTNEQEKIVVRGRFAARFAAVQALYQQESAGQAPLVIMQQFLTHRFSAPSEEITYIKPDTDLFRLVFLGFFDNQERVDCLITTFLSADWPMDRIDAVIRAILRAATVELLGLTTVPVPVIMNEYLNVTKDYFTEKEVAFVNGTLDSIAKSLSQPAPHTGSQPAPHTDD